MSKTIPPGGRRSVAAASPSASVEKWTLADLERSLSRRQMLEIDLSELENDQERDIAFVRERFGQDMASLQIQIDVEKKQQLAWLKTHKDQFDGPPRSFEFAAGTVGYRLGQPHLEPLSKWTWEKVLETVKALNPAFIRNVPEVNREQLLAQKDDFGADGLKVFGLKVVQDDKPFIEIKREKATPQEANAV